MKKIIPMLTRAATLILAIGCIIFFSPTAHAEIIEVDVTGEHIMTTDIKEDMATGRAAAEQDALHRAALSNAFIKSYTEVHDLQLTDDSLVTVAGVLLKGATFEHTFGPPSADGKTITLLCRLRGRIDTSQIDAEQLFAQYMASEEKNKRMAELEAEAAKYKKLYQDAVSAANKQEIQDAYTKNRNLYMITKYERDLDIFDLDKVVNSAKLTETAQKLAEIDPQNAVAFRILEDDFRINDDLSGAVNYCQRMLKEASEPNLMIEIYTHLGDIYLNEYNDRDKARVYADKAIAIVKANKSPAEIEREVNGSNSKMLNFMLVGKTNIIRELYIMKSEIEDAAPLKVESETTIEDTMLTDDTIVGKYRTDW